MPRPIDSSSWTACAVLTVAVVAIIVALVLLFLPYFQNSSKSSAGTVNPPNPHPLDPSYWQDQGGGLWKDASGNIFTGTITYINTRDGNWDSRLWKDDLTLGTCCDIFQAQGFAFWTLFNLYGAGRLPMCNNRCNHERPHSCLLGPNYFAWLISAGLIGLDRGIPYNPTWDYTRYFQGPNGVFYFPQTDLFLFSPPLLACDRHIYVVANGTIEA